MPSFNQFAQPRRGVGFDFVVSNSCGIPFGLNSRKLHQLGDEGVRGVLGLIFERHQVIGVGVLADLTLVGQRALVGMVKTPQLGCSESVEQHGRTCQSSGSSIMFLITGSAPDFSLIGVRAGARLDGSVKFFELPIPIEI